MKCKKIYIYSPSHPLKVTSAKGLEQESQRRPITPALHLHWPVIGSQRFPKEPVA